jgi:hypothetical protein
MVAPRKSNANSYGTYRAGLRQTRDEQKGLALRPANQMLRNLMNALDKGGTLA